MSSKKLESHEQEPVIETTKTGKPSMLYKVYLVNDDYTPMDFVVEVLERFFAMGKTQAVEIMLEVHQKGRGECGLYTRDIAETKVVQVNEYARRNQHPLLCNMEEN